jgi:hypothetical protein
MKKITLLFCLVLLMQNAFAQAPMGDFYAADSREFGFMNKIVKANLALQPDGAMKLIFDKNEYLLQDLGGNQYQSEDIDDKDNVSFQLFLREDKDWLLYLIKPQLRVPRVEAVFLLTAKKEEAKERWKKIKDEYTPLVGKTPTSQEDIRFAYYYNTGGNKTAYIKLDKAFTGAEEIKIYLSQYTNHTFTKLVDNTYIYAHDHAGSVTLVFARFFPTENKLMVIGQPFGDSPNIYVTQKATPPTKNDADDKKLKDLQAFIQNHLVKHRTAYFSSFKSYTSADLPTAKMNTLVKGYFEETHTVSQIKLLNNSWTLTRNEFGRVLRRLQTILVYLKDKKTGKCGIAFRFIGQEFDGSTYGELLIYKDKDRAYTLEDDKKNSLQVYDLASEYEIPCNELGK